MKVLVNTGQRYRDGIIRSRLTELGHETIQIHNNDFERSAGKDMVGLYLHDCITHTSLLRKVRSGHSNIEPFAPVTIISPKPNDFMQGNIGVSVILEESFPVNSVDSAIKSMFYPEEDFIFISDIYIGPERRKESRIRPFDRRKGFHTKEVRFIPKIFDNSYPQWEETLNGQRLHNTLLEFRSKIQESSNRKPIILELITTLKSYNFNAHRISEVTGIRV